MPPIRFFFLLKTSYYRLLSKEACFLSDIYVVYIQLSDVDVVQNRFNAQ